MACLYLPPEKMDMKQVPIIRDDFFSALINECGPKSIFVAKLFVVLNFCILINNELTPGTKI